MIALGRSFTKTAIESKATSLRVRHAAWVMTRLPLGPRDRAWLLLRLFVLGLVLMIHPLPFDLRGWGLVIPARSARSAYVVFECLQTAVFTAALFYGDMLPGMRWATANYRRLLAEVREASLGMKLVKTITFGLVLSLTIWLLLYPVEAVVYAVPPGAPRFCAATAFFIVEHFAITILFIIIVNSSDNDDEPGLRRRSIAQSLAALFRLGRVRAVPRARATTSAYLRSCPQRRC